MASTYPYLHPHPKDVRLNDLTSHVQPSNQLIVNLAEAVNQIAVHTNIGETIDPSIGRLAQRVQDTNKAHKLEQVIRDRIDDYTLGPISRRDLTAANIRFKEERDLALLEQNPNYRPEKIEHQLIKLDSGHTSMFSYEQGKVITVAYEQAIKKELFADCCMVQYRVFEKTLVSKIPTLFKILNKAEEVGIEKKTTTLGARLLHKTL